VLAAGGIVDADDVRAVLDAGATAAVAGTRFLRSDECRAHTATRPPRAGLDPRRQAGHGAARAAAAGGAAGPRDDAPATGAAVPRPAAADRRGPDNLLASGPLYAGANVGRISFVRPAAELVAALTP
jgi:nitronate monooxygenase